MRLYDETLGLGNDPHVRCAHPRPCVLLEAPHEILTPPRAWIDASLNVVRYTKLRGGSCLKSWSEMLLLSLLQSTPRWGRANTSLRGSQGALQADN